MRREMRKKIVGTILLVAFALICSNESVVRFLAIPTSVTVFQGEQVEIEKSALMETNSQSQEAVTVIKQTDSKVAIAGENIGEEDLVFSIAGLPVKKTKVRVLKEYKIIPGGQSLGVQLNTLGVLVVGYHKINGESPGEKADIRLGDVISEINGKKISEMEDVSKVIQQLETEAKLHLKVFRNNKSLSIDLKPVQDKKDQTYKMGLYIRDSASGIGTLSFYDPKTKRYGALGHVISDADTKKPILVKDGTIYNSTVTAIERGAGGNPGEKMARFSQNQEPIGNITANTPFGIFGEMTKPTLTSRYNKPMPIALASEVKKGPAEILTVVDGKKVEKFDIEIVSTVAQKFPELKGLVIKVTDKRLLDRTGGIVQGMSGSPIIQKGKVVGAVTHVFVHDPTSGYGVHMEWMLDQAGIDIYESEKKAS